MASKPKMASPKMSPADLVELRRKQRVEKMMKDQKTKLIPKLGEKKWEEIKIKAGDRERIQTNITCAGYCLYEFMEGDGVTVDVRFYPYNAINGKVIQQSVGKFDKKGPKKSGELLLKEAGKVSFLFSNIGNGFFGGKKSVKYRFVHSVDLETKGGDGGGSTGIHNRTDTFAPQDVW